MPKCAPGMTWGRGKKQPSLLCLSLLVSRYRPIFTKTITIFSPLTLTLSSGNLTFLSRCLINSSSPSSGTSGIHKETLKSRLVDSKWFFGDLEHIQTKCKTAGVILTALRTFTEGVTAVYSEQGMSQSRIIWGAVGRKSFHGQKQMESR